MVQNLIISSKKGGKIEVSGLFLGGIQKGVKKGSILQFLDGKTLKKSGDGIKN